MVRLNQKIKTNTKSKNNSENIKINSSKNSQKELEPTILLNRKKLSFEQKKQLWDEDAKQHKPKIKCDICKQKNKNMTILYDKKEICYRCWIKSNKKSKKNKLVHLNKNVKKESKLDSSIYITNTKYEDIR